MKSELTEIFIEQFRKLPDKVKQLAAKNYKLWKSNPTHPGLNFKKLRSLNNIYSIRIGIGYRALGVLKNKNSIIWFWIGSHSDYDEILKNK